MTMLITGTLIWLILAGCAIAIAKAGAEKQRLINRMYQIQQTEVNPDNVSKMFRDIG